MVKGVILVCVSNFVQKEIMLYKEEDTYVFGNFLCQVH